MICTCWTIFFNDANAFNHSLSEAHCCQNAVTIITVWQSISYPTVLSQRWNRPECFNICLCHCLIANSLGKPAAADLSLGLATAPVLFAAETFPHLNTLIGTSVKFTSRLLYYWCCIVVSVIYQSWWVFYFSDSLIEEIKKSANIIKKLKNKNVIAVTVSE